MTAPTVNWEINIGNILTAVVFVIGLAVAYGSFSAKYEEHLIIINRVEGQTTRIEHYLSSKDVNYWKETGQN